MYRIWIEEVLGFRLRGDHFTVEPSLPADWPGFELTYRHGSAVYEISVSRQPGPGTDLELDGEPASVIPLADDGTHRVAVRIPASAPSPDALLPAPELAAPVAG